VLCIQVIENDDLIRFAALDHLHLGGDLDEPFPQAQVTSPSTGLEI